MVSYKLTDNENCLRKLINDELTNEFVTTDNLDYIQWLEAGNTPLPAYTEEELQEKSKQIRIVELRKLLADSDFRMTFDYYDSMSSSEKSEWLSKRTSWRNELRILID